MGVKQESPDRDALVVGIAQIIDHPSVYMGGPSRNSLRIATEIVKHHRADLCASGQQVRALEWDEIDDGKAFRALLPIIGSVRVEPYGCCGWWEVLWSMPGQCDKLIPDVFDNPDEAKAAAQADYERRILAALTPAPQAEEEKADMVTIPEGNPDLNLAAWMDIRRTQIGPWADYLIREVGKLESEIARMRTATPTAQEAVPVAYQVAMSDGRWGTIFHHPDKPLGEHRPLYARPPQPSETVAEALKLASARLQRLALEIPSTTSLRAAAFKWADEALRALKGGDE